MKFTLQVVLWVTGVLLLAPVVVMCWLWWVEFLMYALGWRTP